MRNWLTILALAVFAGSVVGCDLVNRKAEPNDTEEKTEEEAQKETEIIIPIEAERPERGDISSHFETTTRVQAENRVQVPAEGVGECVEVHAEEGDLVEAGHVLAQLDTTDIRTTIGQGQVQVRQTKTSYDIAEKSLKQGIGSKAERDNAKFAYEQAVAALEAQQVQLQKQTVKAPIGGVVTMRAVQAGQFVATGTPMFAIVDPSSFMLNINPPERELSRLREGQAAKVTIDALANEEFVATVRRVNPNVDPLSGTVKVTLDFDEETRSRLREAAFARVRLVMETHEDALLLPKDAVVEENARKYVFVVAEKEEEEEAEEVEEGAEPEADEEQAEVPEGSVDAVHAAEEDAEKDDAEAEAGDEAAEPDEDAGPVLVAERVEIETGLEDSDFMEVLSGIEDESLIVVLGQHTLKSGARVRVTNAEAEIEAKSGLSAEEALAAAKEKQEAKDLKKDRGRRGHRK